MLLYDSPNFLLLTHIIQGLLHNYAAKNNCGVEKFALYFWEYIKSQTEDFTKINSSACNTPKKLGLTSTNVRQSKQTSLEQTTVHVSSNEVARHNISRELFSRSQTTCTDDDISPCGFKNKKNNSFHGNEERNMLNNHSRDVERKGRRSTEFNHKREKKDSTVAFNERQTNIMTSTPIGGNSSNKRNSNNNALRKSTGSPMCLGDFIVGSIKTKRRSLGNEVKSETTPLTSTDHQTKPKKRVAPITLSKTVSMKDNFASENSFASSQETVHTNERALLKLHKEEITNDFIQQTQEQSTRSLHAAFKDKILESPQIPPVEIDLTKVTNKNIILRLADIFSILLDLNLSVNILTEISFLVNLINTEVDPFSKEIIEVEDIHTSILKNLNNCIYFALSTLSRLKSLLVMLDVKTINVLMKNDRIVMNDVDLANFLKGIFQFKSNLSSNLIEGNNVPGYSYVFFQQENDSKGNFPSEREFGAFKKQRDMFCAIFKSWEQKHLNPTFNFAVEYKPKVQQLLGIIDHPINMAHLAKLFTSQLIISCNFDQSASELQMALPSIDLAKLSKLRQRLVAPSVFSTQYLFPGNQAFFQDFIIACDNHAVFLEQLKLALIAELMEMNDASYSTHIDIECSIEELDINTTRTKSETGQIIQPSTIITMRVLAKFIGFVTSQPYTYDNHNVVVDTRQIHLRNLLLPAFDIKPIILKSAVEKKLIVTIPWIVQYLYMLDYVSLCLNYYKDIFRILYKIYTDHYGDSLAEAFIIRACLGWLFEHCSLMDDYFSYRMELQSNVTILNHSLVLYDPDSIERYLSPHLEHIIIAACPFLADLRVSIMPSRFEKQVSRTGRFRHITTIQAGHTNQKEIDSHTKLTEAFLQSQSLSVRRIVEFVVERVTSAVVKDFQYKNLIPIKNEAMEEVKLIRSTDSKLAYKEMHEKYLKSFALLIKIWDETVSDAIDQRAKMAFEALLPSETIENVKKTCINIAAEKILRKVNDWRAANIKGTDIFSKTIRSDAERLAKSNEPETEQNNTNFSLQLTENLPSEFLFSVHQMQHNASLHPTKISKEILTQFLTTAHDVLITQTFTSNIYRTIAFALLIIVQTLIVSNPDVIDEEIFDISNKIWKLEKLSYLVRNSPQSTPTEEEYNEPQISYKKRSKNIFVNLISARLILQLGASSSRDNASLKCLLNWLRSLVDSHLITVDRLSEMFVGLFQYEWNKENLDKIRYLSKSVAQFNVVNDDDRNDAKSNLFLDLVADLAGDLDI